MKMPAALATTVALTARPTPGAPPVTPSPKWQLASAMPMPKTTLLTRPFMTSPMPSSPGEAVVERPGLDAEEELAGVSRAEQRERVGEERREKQRRDDRDEARHDEERDGIDGEDAQGVDLLGHRHRAELGGVVGADAARDHERREQRRDLAQRAEAGAPAEQLVSRRCAARWALPGPP